MMRGTGWVKEGGHLSGEEKRRGGRGDKILEGIKGAQQMESEKRVGKERE